MDGIKILRSATSAAAVAFGATALTLASPAQAALVLTADVSGTVFSCTDQTACDNNPMVGALGIGTTSTPVVINGVQVFGSLTFAEDTDSLDFISSSSLQVINTSGANRTITAAVGATDFSGGPAGTFDVSGSGTFFVTPGSTIMLGYYVDPGNAQGGQSANDTPGVLVSQFMDTATTVADSFSHEASGGAVTSNPYSMTLQFQFTLDPDGRLTSRGQVLAVNSPIPIDVPEPVSLALFGMGLLGLGAAVRARRQG